MLIAAVPLKFKFETKNFLTQKNAKGLDLRFFWVKIFDLKPLPDSESTFKMAPPNPGKFWGVAWTCQGKDMENSLSSREAIRTKEGRLFNTKFS